MLSSVSIQLYHISCSHFRWTSIGLFHILHQPGIGIDIFSKKYNIGDNKSIDALIFYIFSKSKLSDVIFVVSK